MISEVNLVFIEALLLFHFSASHTITGYECVFIPAEGGAPFISLVLCSVRAERLHLPCCTVDPFLDCVSSSSLSHLGGLFPSFGFVPPPTCTSPALGPGEGAGLSGHSSLLRVVGSGEGGVRVPQRVV